MLQGSLKLYYSASAFNLILKLPFCFVPPATFLFLNFSTHLAPSLNPLSELGFQTTASWSFDYPLPPSICPFILQHLSGHSLIPLGPLPSSSTHYWLPRLHATGCYGQPGKNINLFPKPKQLLVQLPTNSQLLPK